MERESSLPHEGLQHVDKYAVVIPYASNINSRGANKGKIRPTFFSDFVLNAAYEHYVAQEVNKLILCGEKTFGDDFPSTSDLMKERLIRLGVPERNIITVGTTNINTAEQIGAVAQYQQINHLEGSEFTVISLGYHKPRINTHMKGFAMNGKVVLAEDIHAYHNPKFNRNAFNRLVGKRSTVEELPVRVLGYFDPRGEKVANKISQRIGVRTYDLYPEIGAKREEKIDKNGKRKMKRPMFVPSRRRLKQVFSAA